MRVAVVGAGPAGAYTAEALLRYGHDVRVDVLDRLPTPFGLVRYGVAPDHVRTQTISTALAAVLSDPGVRFLGNVELGTDVTVADLHRCYDAVVVTTGAAVDRHLGVPGEERPGSVSATELVAWYCGHPDTPPDAFDLTAGAVAVVGAGNVAGDVARMLARTAAELAVTDVPDHVLATFAVSRVRDVHLVVRRGPAETRFTTRELREIGELADADVEIDPQALEPDDLSGSAPAGDAVARRNLELLRSWAQRPPAGRSRRVHLHFHRRPVEVLGDPAVSGLVVERTVPGPGGSATGTGDTSLLDVQMVVRAVGYRSLPVPGVPFDDVAGVVPTDGGRVLRDGVPVPGEYVAGWLKRGPSGVIGTNKHDARETVRSLLADAEDGRLPAPDGDPDALLERLRDTGHQVVDWAGWLAIDAAETALGRAQGRARSKIADRDTLLRAAAQGVAAPVTR